ncbi:liprin-beta-2b isoform X3 [Salarias fasciatus]|uniref:Liprin-beta-2-like n=1 Tax=Salarias fasciatus TaxID=181472 RepID=A0A672HJ87_SALFA|nr:liprin-beta-2-like isoform X3 [Salarias fasciatus]
MLPAVAMETEASHMLQAALEQMDDIIAGSKAAAMDCSSSVLDLGSGGSCGSGSSGGPCGPLQVLQLAEDLKLALDLQPGPEQRDSLRNQLPAGTVQTLMDWLGGEVNLCSPANNETYQERLLRLEGDKESLVLQVSVLTDQVEAQGEKIRDLESSLEEHRQKLASTEEMLQQELMNRTSLETQKLDLMDEVSYLKLKLVSMEDTHSNTHSQDPADTQQNKAQCVVNLISELQEQMCRFQEEISSRIQEKRALEEREVQQEEAGGGRVRVRVRDRGPPVAPATSDLSLSSSDVRTLSGGQRANDLLQETKQLRSKVEELEDEKSQNERRLRETKAEILELQQLLASRDAEIECLQTQLLARGGAGDPAQREEVYVKQLINKYQEYQRLKVGMESLLASNDEKDRRIEELTVLLAQYRKMREAPALTLGSSEEELSGSLKLRAITYRAQSDILRSEMSSRGSSPLMLSSSPYQRDLESSFQNSVEVSLMSAADTSFFNGSCPRRRLLSSSLEELQSGSFQKAVDLQPVESQSDVGSEDPQPELSRFQTLPGKRIRAPERRARPNGDDCGLGRQEKLDQSVPSDPSPPSSGLDSGEQSPVSPENRKTRRGIKKLWGRIRRSQSGSPVQLHDPDMGDFRRGGFRATAGPRLARSGRTRDLKTPFSEWSPEQVSDWLEDIGLGQYAVLARQWVSGGRTLLSASPQELEKELAMKNPLHRKKLQLRLRTAGGSGGGRPEKSAELDHIWVTRWLDDIGLPQYKDQFNEGRVDGQMLQYLTVNDLLFLKVTSQLHHLSIRSALQVLHLNHFDPDCLKRRPGSESGVSPGDVLQWSNHRVMEWLRSVDLAEYAPNLRGSGVHGGLIILEPRFGADALALLLNISPQKTLLRRHLGSNFSSLVGPAAARRKAEGQGAPGSTLSVTAKVKPKKLGFPHLAQLRRRRPDESTDYVCPMDTSPPALNGEPPRPHAAFRGLSPILDREPDRRGDRDRDQMVITEGTVLQIEALSESINNLTYMLGRDELRSELWSELRPQTALV